MNIDNIIFYTVLYKYVASYELADHCSPLEG